MINILVKDMTTYDYIKACKARQEMGTLKYGDSDRLRDTSKDVAEEIFDIDNILMRRKKWLVELDYDEDVIEEYEEIVRRMMSRNQEQFKDAKEIDELMHRIKYDTRDVKRIYFDE